ncbi:MarR family winged helix-turn-helix transcriptional regulator [Prauserella rugosa]|uniref:DNA-binding MarR family transcriptional regulator n=1 Tax=Prauserella rugosa TaxID=43354 RepID=A0A660CCB8_9PSEU|nr:MarR family transcriptional regulator [Prauserella rugosa]KID31789.1 transcriptional regulator [Prauserella sp. Am3]KMS83068.1 MarR family transcriptional regulator [Streptomyces regensis]TWH20976.1 DNA-binding MarR family transcriptional regulator [Prauserella rugosa]
MAAASGGDEAEQQSSLASRLRLAVVRLNRRLRAQRVGTDLSLTQVAALSTLHQHGAMTPGKLAAHEGVQPPSMTRVIAALEAVGYVERTPHPTDGRQAIVTITDAGLAYVHESISVREAWLDRRLHELSGEEREVLDRAATIIQRMAGNS